jgi:hypothetical protein
MANRLETHIFLLMLWLAPSYSGAADLDFDKNIVCELEYFEICKHGDHSCRWGEVVDVDGKQIFTIDIKEKRITLHEGGNLIDREPINSISVVNEVLYLHGTNPDSNKSTNGTGWMARIEKTQGELSAASLADTKGYLLFGACSNQ